MIGIDADGVTYRGAATAAARPTAAAGLPHRDLGRGRRRLAARRRAGARHRRDARPRRPDRRRARPEPAGHPEIAVVGDLAAAMSHGKGEPSRCPASAPAPSRWAAPPRPTCCAGCAASRRGRSATSTTATWRRSGRKAAIVDLAVPGSGALRFSGFAGLAVLAVRPHLLPDRLSQPPDRHGRLGLGVFHVRAQRPGGRRAGARTPPRPRSLESKSMDTRTSPARLNIERIREVLREAAAAPPRR